ncbi:unnamed protein product [Mucor hiemalis]
MRHCGLSHALLPVPRLGCLREACATTSSSPAAPATPAPVTSSPSPRVTPSPPPPTSPSSSFIVAFIPGHRAFSPLHSSESNTESEDEVESNAAFTGQALFPIGDCDSGSCYCSHHSPSESESDSSTTTNAITFFSSTGTDADINSPIANNLEENEFYFNNDEEDIDYGYEDDYEQYENYEQHEDNFEEHEHENTSFDRSAFDGDDRDPEEIFQDLINDRYQTPVPRSRSASVVSTSSIVSTSSLVSTSTSSSAPHLEIQDQNDCGVRATILLPE